MEIMHFATTAERLRFLREPKQEVKPVEVKKEENKFSDDEKPKKKPTKKASSKRRRSNGTVQA